MSKHTAKWRDKEKKAKAARDRRLSKKEAKAAAEATAAAVQAKAAQTAAANPGGRESTRQRPASATGPTAPCRECDACGCGGCPDQAADPTGTSPEVTIAGLQKLLAAAEAAKTAKDETIKEAQAKAQRSTAALAKRERGPEAMAPERLLEAFADTDSGEPRASAEAVERAAQRAIKRSIDALPDDHEQHGGLHVGGVQQGELDARSVEGLLREAHLHAPPVEWAVRELEAWAGGICAERGTGAGGSPAAAHLKVARLHASQLRRAQVPEGQR